MKLQKMSVSAMNPAPYNPRVALRPGDAVYENLKRSIETFGYVEPIIVNKRTGHVVGGHQRLTVMKDLGHREVEVVVVNLPLAQEKALNLTLNKTVGAWDEEKLAHLLQDLESLPEFDITLTGFAETEVADLVSRMLDGVDGVGGTRQDDFDVEAELRANRPLVTKPGEMIELGAHRLLCGDATKAEDVRRLMGGERAVLFATDPPYLVGYDGMNHPGKRGKWGMGGMGWMGGQRGKCGRDKNKDWSGSYGISWDDAKANPDLYEKFYGVAVAEAVRRDAAWYCWHASRRQAMVEGVWGKYGAFVHQQIIWVKDRPILTRSHYSWQHEPCFFGWVRPHKPPRVAKDYPSTIWAVPTVPVGQPTEHPTSKPVELFAIPIRQHTRRGEVCYEPFCGSGTQIIAAEQLGRQCRALEISPQYCDLIVRRWIHTVGEGKAPRKLVKRYRVRVKEAAHV